MMWLKKGILLCSCMILTACTVSQASLSEDFDRSVKAYNRLLRWHEIESAGMTYIDPQLRGEYLMQAESLKKRGLAVADYRILRSRYLPEKKSGEVIAEFDYYILPSNRIKTVPYRQEWVYQEEIKSWVLKTGLPVFE